MLKIIFLSLFLSTYSFANEESNQSKTNDKIFKKSSLTKKDDKEDNINVLPFYTVKELKEANKEEIKINKEEIKTLNQFKVALEDKKRKLEDAESTLKYFQEMYSSKKLDSKRTVLELKWSLRVIAKRKDAIVRLNKRYKQSFDLTSFELEQYQNEINSEKEGKELINQLENETSNQSNKEEIVKEQKKVLKNGPTVTGNIQKDQQAAYKFYKNKTYHDVITKNKEKKEVEAEIMQPQSLASSKVETKVEEPVAAKVDEAQAIMQIPMIDSVPMAIEKPKASDSVSTMVVEPKVEVKIEQKQEEKPNENKVTEPVPVKQDVVDKLELKKDEEKLGANTSKDTIIKNEEAIKPDPSQLKETLEIVNLKMSQQKIEKEYKDLLEKYKQLEQEAKIKDLKSVVKEPEKKQDLTQEKNQEKPAKIIIIDEKPLNSVEKGQVKINSIKEQLNGDLDGRDGQNLEQTIDKDEDVMYYRGNGIEEEGSMEESEGPAY